MRVFNSIAEYAAEKGKEIGVSDWVLLDQARVNLFADATGDHQWIHIDPERTQRELGMGTIAHGYLTLSLLPELMSKISGVKSVTRGINYGANSVRFTNMVPVGSRVRARVSLKDAVEKAGGTQIVNDVTIEIEGVERPAMVAETLTILYE
ncbi:MAG: MaoC family dehydratase [Rhizobiales bacterium]|nr:MaoC family dehydratase [Hyphomicrobiales bacterium]